MGPLEAAANTAFERRLDTASTAPIAVALSGGGDSIALLWLAAAWARAHGRSLLAIHVDHAINPKSAAWRDFAADAAARAAAGFLSLAWEGPKPAAGLPAAARAARHRLLAQGARAAGARALLTGHTHDDALEGERMRETDVPALGRLREWSPSPAWPEGRGLFLLRPLLDIRRSDLRDWLRARGETWIEDPANGDLRYARSRARAALAGPSPLAGEGGAAPLPPMPTHGPRPPPQGGRVTEDGRIVLPRHGLDAATLSAALLSAAGTDRPPRGLQVEGLLERLAGSAPVDATLAGARLVADGAAVQIGRDAGERFRGGLLPLDLPESAPVVWDGRFEIVADVPGLQVQPLGGVIARLAKPDRARLKAVPAWARGALPALVTGDGGVSLPRPLGDGAARATPLSGPRLAAARGLVTTECDIGDAPHGAGGLLILCSGPRP